MKPEQVELEELRRSVDARKRNFDSAVANLAQVSTDSITLSGRMARDPWGWLFGACVAGVVLAFVVGDTSEPEPVRRSIF